MCISMLKPCQIKQGMRPQDDPAASLNNVNDILKVHEVESPRAPQQRNCIFICRDGIAYNIVEHPATLFEHTNGSAF